MTQGEIIEMARQADVWTEENFMFADILNPKIEAFAKLIAEAEREAFKQIIQQTPLSNWFQADVIEAIDKRGQA
jgi:hypothetical protein